MNALLRVAAGVTIVASIVSMIGGQFGLASVQCLAAALALELANLRTGSDQ